ncbi:MAG TPA: hypothetical protein PKH77_13370 [Anaerolineae bacterium]|nr:hypothetical protein [Anaerolineae bacterium]
MEFLSQLQQDILRYLWQAMPSDKDPESAVTWACAGNPASGSGTMFPTGPVCPCASAVWQRVD